LVGTQSHLFAGPLSLNPSLFWWMASSTSC